MTKFPENLPALLPRLSAAPQRAAKNEPRKLKARYYRGLLQLAEPLDLPDDTEVEITLRPKNQILTPHFSA